MSTTALQLLPHRREVMQIALDLYTARYTTSVSYGFQLFLQEGRLRANPKSHAFKPELPCGYIFPGKTHTPRLFKTRQRFYERLFEQPGHAAYFILHISYYILYNT